jgi:tRNA threonylcarbamoyladenosine biosynthesis protein TsaB
MACILCIETAENICSVALFNDLTLLSQISDNQEKSHSERLTVLIQDLFNRVNMAVNAIDAIAVSKGPGSYTGLRIGVSVAKGICYAIHKPLIGVNTLEILSYNALSNEFFKKNKSIPFSLCPMIDARRMEVYLQFFDSHINPESEISAEIISSNSFSDLLNNRTIVFFGSGADKIEPILSHNNAVFLNGIRPLAKFMISPALKSYHDNHFEDVAYFEPYYLKNFVATRQKKNLLK